MDEDDFLQAMGDVKPLNLEARVNLKKAEAADLAQAARRESAVAEPISDSNLLSGDYVEPLDPAAILDFKRPGIQHGVYRNLRLGKYTIDARLDLHGATVEQSRGQVFQFVRDCVQHDIRCALITHGKGKDRKPQQALLKSCVAHWLPQLDEVQAFHSAKPQHGGVGATYILLRKSEKKRLENMENYRGKAR